MTNQEKIEQTTTKPDPNCKFCFGTGCSCGGIGYSHWSDDYCCSCIQDTQFTKE